MSDNTMSTAASLPALSAHQTPAAKPQQDFAADTELVLAAIARMEAAVRGERATHERVRDELAGMADAIAHVKTSIRNAQTTGKPVNVMVLLTWLEARVHGMRADLGESSGAKQAAAPEPASYQAAAEVTQPESVEAATAEAVPTVSEVISRLGRASDVLEREAQALEQSASKANDVPTVSMLGAMVEALTATESVAAKAQAEAPAQSDEPAAAERAFSEPDAAFNIAPEAAITEVASTIVAEDSAPEIAAFSEELGMAELTAPEAVADNESESAQPEARAEDAVVADEPTTDVVLIQSVILEANPDTDVFAFISEPVDTETAVAEAPPPERETVQTIVETIAVVETVAVITNAHEPSAHEFELLTSFAAMEAIPFMPDEIGTAVIFEQKTEFDPAAEQMAFETPAMPVETAAQPDVAAAIEHAIETTENAEAKTEPTAHVEARDNALPNPAVSAREAMIAAALGNHPVYAGVSSLAVSIGVMGVNAARADATEMEAATAGVLEIVAPSEAVEPQAETAETNSKIDFFELGESITKSQAITAADVIAESALDLIVAEPITSEASELAAETEHAEEITQDTTAVVAPEFEAPAPEPTSAAFETVSADVAATTEMADSEAKIAEHVHAQAETAPFDAADDDLSDLFEPEPDAALDPNNVLLGPAPAPAFTLDPATAAVLPMHDMALPQTKPSEAKPDIATSPAPAKTHDPLAPLKAMSDEEKIALFS